MGISGQGREVLRYVSGLFADGADIDGPTILRIECLNVRQDDLSDVDQADFFWHLIHWLAEYDESRLMAHAYSAAERGTCVAAVELWDEEDHVNPVYMFWLYGIRVNTSEFPTPAPRKKIERYQPPRKAVAKKAAPKKAVPAKLPKKASPTTYYRKAYGRIEHIVSTDRSKTLCGMATNQGAKFSDRGQDAKVRPLCDNCRGLMN